MCVLVALLLLAAATPAQESQPQSRLAPEQRIEALVRELVTARPERAEQARRQLLLFGADAVPQLMTALRERCEEPWLNENLPEDLAPISGRAQILRTLRALGPAAEPAIPELLTMLALLPETQVRAGQEALLAIGPAAVPLLRKALRSEPDRVVIQLVRVLTKLDARVALPELRECLADCSRSVRVAVVEALWAFGDDPQRCIRELIECLHDEGSGPFTARSKASLESPVDRAIELLVAHGQAVVPALVQALGNPDERVRRHAAWAAGQLKAASAVPVLRRGLLQEEPAGQLTRLWALAQIGSAAAGAAPELVVLLRQPALEPGLQQAVVRALVAGGPGILRWMLPLCADWDPEMRRRAVGIVGMLGPDASAAVPALVERLSDHNPSVAMAAASALGRLGPAARDAVVPLLRDDQARRRELAALALKNLGEQASAAAPQLAMGLTDPADDARRACFAALAGMGAVGTVHLIQALSHPDVEVRRLAARTLGSIGAPACAAAEALAVLLDHPEDAAAPDAAWALGQLGPLPVPIAQRLQTALQSPGAELRSRALEALVHGDRTAAISVARVRESLRHPDPQVRLAALRALRGVGEAGRAALPEVVEAARDGDVAVQREAVSWLGDFGPLEPRVVLALCEAFTSADRYVRFRALAGLSRDATAVRGVLDRIQEDPQSSEPIRALVAIGIEALAEPAWRK